MPMHVNDFYQARQADWQALTRLLDRRGTLTPEEVQTLGQLYRAATADLALAQRDFARQPVVEYLNQLVARAHAALYRSDPLVWRQLWDFVRAGFPRLYRELWVFTLVAALLLFVPALLAGVITAQAPTAAVWLLPEGVRDLIPQIQQQDLWTDIPINERPYASAFIMQNNIQVSFLAFAGGITAGLLTVWMMVFNGLLIGGLLGLTTHYGVGFELATFMVAHGAIELSVVCMVGGAGLRLGWALLHPGLLTRRAAVAQAANKAVRLAISCVPMLIVAGLIEGFISPAENIPWPVKWSIGAITGGLLYAYWGLAGREKSK